MKIQSLDEALFKVSEGLKEASRAPNIKKYKPHEKQYAFHSSTKKKKLYIGGNRSGKTTGGVCEAIWRATNRHPYRSDLNELGPNRGRVIAVDFINGVEKIIFPQYQQWLYPSALKGGAWETAYNKMLRTLTFSNNSTIEFMSYDQDLDKFAGTSRHWIHFDEEPPQSIYIENMARIIDTDGEFWITMTPVEGMTWVHEELYEGNVDNPDGPVEIIEINTLENPYLSSSAVQSFTQSIDDDEIRSRIEGKFVQVGGRIYKEFDPTVGGLHVLEDEVEKPKQRFKDWMWICSLDHGLSNPTSVHWTAVNVKGECITFEEHYQGGWTIDKHAEAIHSINRRHGRVPDLYVADPSIQNRNAVTGTSIQQEYASLGIPFILGNNDVKAGIVRFKKYLRPVGTGKEKVPMWRCTPNCTNLIREAKKYRWKTYANKKMRSENNSYEEPHKKDDHSMDDIRYMIMTRPDLRADSQNQNDKLEQALQGFDFASAAPRNRVADPYDLGSNPNWTELNSVPNGYGTGWDYDEHMGGIY